MRFIFNPFSRFKPQGDPGKFLSVAYILALSVIAALALGSHLIVARMHENQKQASEIVYIAGRQRVLAQEIALRSATYALSGKEEEMYRLENAIFSFKMGHKYLTEEKKEESGEDGTLIAGEEGLEKLPANEDPLLAEREPIEMSPELHNIYFSKPFQLDQQVRDYIAAAETYITDNNLVNRQEREKMLNKVLYLGTGRLINSLDIAAQRYQEESLMEIDNLSRIQLKVFVYLMVTLLVEAVFIFRPLVMNVRKYASQLKRLALYDELTGMRNRRAFMNMANAEWSRAIRHKTPFCFAILDIDKFKSVNDTYGHAAGDDVLRHFSALLEECVRQEDVVGRIGGEEFAILLPGTSLPKGASLIERIREKVEKTPCPVKTPDKPEFMLDYTASFGVVSLNEGEEASLEELIHMADELLYEAKESGRNKVCVQKRESDA